jgi:hypothetical protein
VQLAAVDVDRPAYCTCVMANCGRRRQPDVFFTGSVPSATSTSAGRRPILSAPRESCVAPLPFASGKDRRASGVGGVRGVRASVTHVARERYYLDLVQSQESLWRDDEAGTGSPVGAYAFSGEVTRR